MIQREENLKRASELKSLKDSLLVELRIYEKNIDAELAKIDAELLKIEKRENQHIAFQLEEIADRIDSEVKKIDDYVILLRGEEEAERG